MTAKVKKVARWALIAVAVGSTGFSQRTYQAGGKLPDGFGRFGIAGPGATMQTSPQTKPRQAQPTQATPRQARPPQAKPPQAKSVMPRIDQVVPWPEPEAAGMIIEMQFKQPLLEEHVGRAVAWRGTKWAAGGSAGSTVHVMRIGDQHYNVSLALCSSNPIAQFPPGAVLDIKGKLAPYYDRFRQYGTSRWTLYLEDGASATLAKDQPSASSSQATRCDMCGGVPDFVVYTPAMTSARRLLPTFEKGLPEGKNQWRLQNDQETSYVVGFRRGDEGKDVEVPPKKAITIYLPDGIYEAYAFFPAQQDALFQAQSITLPMTTTLDILKGELKRIK